MTKISIIIPTLNEEKVIRRTISSFTGMQIPHEIIVSDGGGKDATVAISREMGATVFVHDNSYRQTIAEGRNVGGDAATGDIMMFLDADCVIHDADAFFLEIKDYFDAHPEVVAISPALRVLPEYATWMDLIVMWCVNLSYRVLTNWLGIPSAPGECQIMRRSAYQAIGGYNKNLIACEDLDLFSRISKMGKVHHLADLHVWHTCRRAHKIGWPKLLWLWFINAMTFMIHGKAFSKEWEPIR